MELHSITNGKMTAVISSRGAHLQSLKTLDGTELIFQGDDMWKGKSPNLYPIVGVFPEGKYSFEGKEYDLPCHGFASTREYTVESRKEDEIVFLMTDDEETKKVYPFSFRFRVIYRLTDEGLRYTLSAENTDDKTAYCEMGVHTGYPVAKSFKGAKIVFDLKEKFYTFKNNDPAMCGSRVINEDNELLLRDDLFEVGAVTFGALNSKKVTLVREGRDHDITVDLGDYKNLTLWAAPGASFICIEPWSCESAHYAVNTELTRQSGISVLSPGETVSFTCTVGYVKR